VTAQERQCQCAQRSLSHQGIFLFPITSSSLIMQFFQFCVAFEVMHTFTLDGQTNYANLEITFSIFLPLLFSCTLKTPCGERSLYLAIVAPGILPKAPVKSTPVSAWIAGGKVPINLFTSCVVLLPPPISTIWSVLASGADTSAAI